MAVSDANKDTAKLPTLTRCMDGTGLFSVLVVKSPVARSYFVMCEHVVLYR